MTNRDMMKRLERLNGGPLRFGDRPEAEREQIARRAAEMYAPSPATEIMPIVYARLFTVEKSGDDYIGEVVPLETAVPGEVVKSASGGVCYQAVTRVADLNKRWHVVRDKFSGSSFDPNAPMYQRCEARGVMAPTHDGILFVDLETTGLAQTPLFLIGTLGWEDDDLVVRQYLARDYSEEAATIELFAEELARRTMLSSFNGKSFDIPYVRMRSIANGIKCEINHPHFDLLHECRRVWKGSLPNCKLQTLEQRVCGRPARVGDIPGRDIPMAYHSFVRTGDATEIAQIMRHNLLDLLTLAELVTKLPLLEEVIKKK
ncbi:MAG: ribonuclease H-like domain-containing protein [bacterium]